MAELLFPLYELLVENIFGTVGLSIFGVGFILVLILMICGVRMDFITPWLTLYFVVMLTYWFGPIFLMLTMLIFLAILLYQVIKMFEN